MNLGVYIRGYRLTRYPPNRADPALDVVHDETMHSAIVFWSRTLVVLLVSSVAEELDGELGTFWTQEVLLLPKDLLLEPGVVSPEYTCRSDRRWSKRCVTYMSYPTGPKNYSG